jgi:hypothetical protein
MRRREAARRLYAHHAVLATKGAGALATGDYITIAGFAATLIGLVLTWIQVRRARTAAEATEKSMQETLGKVARDEMLRLIDVLLRTERDLQAAVDAQQRRTSVGERLADWRDQASGLWQLVHEDKRIPHVMRDDLLRSVKLASELRSRLPEVSDPPAPVDTAELRALVSTVCGHLATVGQIVRYGPEDSSDATA